MKADINTLINYRGYIERRNLEIEAPHKLSKQVGKKRIDFCKQVFINKINSKP